MSFDPLTMEANCPFCDSPWFSRQAHPSVRIPQAMSLRMGISMRVNPLKACPHLNRCDYQLSESYKNPNFSQTTQTTSLPQQTIGLSL